jgi:hypothetical protein
MTEVSDGDEREAGSEQRSLWSRLADAVLPDKMLRRWDRLPEGSQQDAAHYNMRSGL